MRPWRVIHFGGERNAKNNEMAKIQQQQGAANNPRVFALEEPAGKKNNKTYSVVQEQVRVPRYLVRIT